MPDAFRPLAQSLQGLNQTKSFNILYIFTQMSEKQLFLTLVLIQLKKFLLRTCVLCAYCVTSQWVSCYLWQWLWYYHSEQQQIVVERPGNCDSYCTMLYVSCDHCGHCFIGIEQIGLGSTGRIKEIMGDLKSIVKKSSIV